MTRPQRPGRRGWDQLREVIDRSLSGKEGETFTGRSVALILR